jgi:hypothetical protein
MHLTAKAVGIYSVSYILNGVSVAESDWKFRKSIGYYSRCSYLDRNLAPPEYKPTALPFEMGFLCYKVKEREQT